MRLRKGEVLIDSINSVEDTKGNNGERGALQVTNLRITWFSHKSFNTNLSIGYSCIQTISIRTAESTLRGRTQALFLMTKYNGARYEFVFTSLVKASPRLFTTVQTVFRAFETSKLYRDLKLRGAAVREGRLNQLPDEEIVRKVDGVWNLSSDQGNLGVFYMTNVRIVWHAKLAENFNVSIPYMQIKQLVLRDSKFGPALVIETTKRSGGYVLGFRIDPVEQLESVAKEVDALHQVYADMPNFGVRFTVEEAHPPPDELKAPSVEDDVEVVDEDGAGDVLAAYYADGGAAGDRPPVFDRRLGLAVEALPAGFTTEKLWKV